MEPWYKVVSLRQEVREGRSFNPDEFAIHLEQVVAGIAPRDYQIPEQFFSRTSFTRALRAHLGMVLRRLDGRTEHTAPVLTLVTQFGGGKTHTLTALYHLAHAGVDASNYTGISELLRAAELAAAPAAQVAVFVGNAWDPQPGRETPWIDLARQIAQDPDAGVAALGPAALTSPPGTEAIGRLFALAGKPVLLLFDEVLNFINRHRGMAEPFHAFIQNLTVATTGTTRGAAVISLPRSQVEMTDWDLQWQECITKVVRRVAKDLIANDEAEIGEVIRRRLFEDLGRETIRKSVARTYADWCFERRSQLPPGWTAVDTASTETKSREFLRDRFEACYPFHPATLSVFQRKWQALPQYQQTRGTLAMLAQWIAWANRNDFIKARTEPLITLGSAPLDDPGFRATILGQLGDPRLIAAIDADIAGPLAHAHALDADTRNKLRDIHRRVATTILFESSGGQVNKIAHLPELRFALGEPEIETTSIDNAANAVEAQAFFIRKAGTDGFFISPKPKLNKVMSDRRASLDFESDVRPALRDLIKKEFERGASIPIELFPIDSSAVRDTPKLVLVLLDPQTEWSATAAMREQIAEWTRTRSGTGRLYPASLIWSLKKPGKELRAKVETWLAWRRVKQEVESGTLGTEFSKADLDEIKTSVKEAEDDARDEVWASYRFIALADNQEADGLRVIDLGAGHASASETLCGRMIAALKSESLLNESVGAGYIERNWPIALKESGGWPLKGLRQSFLNGALTRLLDPDNVLRQKIIAFVENGDFGLGSGPQPSGSYTHVWFDEPIAADEIAFEDGVFLLTKARAKALKEAPVQPGGELGGAEPGIEQPGNGEVPGGSELGSAEPEGHEAKGIEPGDDGPGGGAAQTLRLRLVGDIPQESWNRFGQKVVTKLKMGSDLVLHVDLTVTFEAGQAQYFETDLRQALEDLAVSGKVKIERVP